MAAHEDKFRFVVKIMPPRRPGNSLFQRLGQSKHDEPMHTIAVPAVASETFADVWKHIGERYERNYGAEEVAKGWFHKLQDRYGADIDSRDGVGDLGYGPNSPREDLTLVMLQNAIDRDGSIPDDSGLRPPGFAKRRLTGEQQEQVKRRKVQAERFGAPLDELDEDTAIVSRERTFEPEDSDSPDAAAEQRMDADGFTVPALPGPKSRKRKRKTGDKERPDPIQSSMEGERDSDVIVPDSQDQGRAQPVIPDSFPTESHASNRRSAHSVPAEGGMRDACQHLPSSRAFTAVPQQRSKRTTSVEAQISSNADAHNDQAASRRQDTNMGTQQSKPQPKPKGPPTPVSGKLPLESQQPPESAQRPKQTPCSTAASTEAQRQVASVEPSNDVVEQDPIEDDDLLQGTAGIGNDDDDADAEFFDDVDQPEQEGDVYAFSNTETTKTPGSLRKNMLAHTPASSAPAPSLSSQGSASRNPRSQHGPKSTWTAAEDAYLLDGLRLGLSATETLKRFKMGNRTASAARSRRILLASKDPSLKTKTGMNKRDGDDDSVHGSSQRQPWVNEDLIILRKAISDGYDALEIQALHFPQRSQDSVNRKVLMLQDKAWKLAESEEFWPDNSVRLKDWTAKDNCKLKRAFRESMPMQEVKDRFFSRWTMPDVQRKVDAYKKQIKALGARPSLLAEKLASSAEHRHVDSSPVQRAVKARETRRGSEADLRHQPAHMASSPPRPKPSTHKTSGAHAQIQTKATRTSSPTVHITSSEQESARDKLSSQRLFSGLSSGKARQTQLTFTREKGKGRAGPARPYDNKLDAQYTRRSSGRSSAAASSSNEQAAEGGDSAARNSDDDDTPADDLDKLQAEIDAASEHDTGGEELESPRRNKRSCTNSLAAQPTPKVVQESPQVTSSPERRKARTTDSVQLPPDPNVQTRRASSGQVANSDDASTTPTANNNKTSVTHQTHVTRPTRSRGSSSLQSPLDAVAIQAPASSRLSSHPFPAPRIDTRAAEQLSIELQRSISSEAPDESRKPAQRPEEEPEESQAFQSQDPETSRSQRAVKKTPKTSPACKAQLSGLERRTSEYQATSQESQAFQTQDPATTISQRAAKAMPIQPTEQGEPFDNRQHAPRAPPSLSQESQAFQTQDSISTRSQRALQTLRQGSGVPDATSLPESRPSAYDIQTKSQSAKAHHISRVLEPSFVSATQPGRLPARGQSYAAQLREAQNVSRSQPAATSTQTYRVIRTPSSLNVLQAEERRPPVPRDQRSPSPTDSLIWKQTANAKELGMDRQEIFEDLKLNTRSIRAMKYEDWDEVARLKAEERRVHRERKIKRMVARGETLPEGFGLKHQPGRAIEDDEAEGADGDVIRDEDVEDVSMSEDDDEDEYQHEDVGLPEPADADEDVAETPEDMDRDRHFSEIEENDEQLEEPKPHGDAGVVKLDGDVAMEDAPAEPTNDEEVPFTHFTDNEDGQEAEELELPTVPMLSDPQDAEPMPLTQEALQELENSGAEASPRRLQQKRKSSPVHNSDKISPKVKHMRNESADKAAMPPPPLRSTMTASSSPGKSKKKSKRTERRKRKALRSSVSGSERSSSAVPSVPTSDPAQHVPSTPRRESAFTAINQAGTPQIKPTQSQASKKSERAPASSNSLGGGLLSMARHAHIPTPPKRKLTPKRQVLGMSTRKSDDESDEESVSSSD